MRKTLIILILSPWLIAIPVSGEDGSLSRIPIYTSGHRDICLDKYLCGRWALIQQSPKNKGEDALKMYVAKRFILIGDDAQSGVYDLKYYDDMHGVLMFAQQENTYVGKIVEVKGYLFMTGVWWHNGEDYKWWAYKQEKNK